MKNKVIVKPETKFSELMCQCNSRKEEKAKYQIYESHYNKVPSTAMKYSVFVLVLNVLALAQSDGIAHNVRSICISHTEVGWIGIRIVVAAANPLLLRSIVVTLETKIYTRKTASIIRAHLDDNGLRII